MDLDNYIMQTEKFISHLQDKERWEGDKDSLDWDGEIGKDYEIYHPEANFSRVIKEYNEQR